ncbi:unnamed protein product [Cuscuta epithymum]|uniref:Uncharacterized protein n=1 Tax=Cuscuta epithymum TaxID=186058 RepID=A0AAV0D6T9_9ASTE|nr:unnamed protein product [Cuscuta epithymum]
MLALRNVVEIKLGTLGCGSPHTSAAVYPLFIFGIAGLILMPSPLDMLFLLRKSLICSSRPALICLLTRLIVGEIEICCKIVTNSMEFGPVREFHPDYKFTTVQPLIYVNRDCS